MGRGGTTLASRIGKGGEACARRRSAHARPQRSHALTPAERFESFTRSKLNVIYVDSDAEAKRMAKLVRELEPSFIGLDFETASKNGHFGSLNGSLRTIQIGLDEPERGITPVQIVIDCHRADPAPFRSLLRSRQVEKLIHYMDFEQEWALMHLGVSIGNIYDTCIAGQEIRKKLRELEEDDVKRLVPGGIHVNNKLATLVSHYCGMEMPKENQASDWSQEQLRPDQVVYAAMDVATMPLIASELKRLASALGIEKEIDKRIAWVKKRIADRVERLQQQNSDDAGRIATALLRAETKDELERIWRARRQMTVFAEHSEQLQEIYGNRRKELSA